jgi:NAD(P)-dependent dehydrogenase (short-subunit alcohol dehydrogenase family)
MSKGKTTLVTGGSGGVSRRNGLKLALAGLAIATVDAFLGYNH